MDKYGWQIWVFREGIRKNTPRMSSNANTAEEEEDGDCDGAERFKLAKANWIEW